MVRMPGRALPPAACTKTWRSRGLSRLLISGRDRVKAMGIRERLLVIRVSIRPAVADATFAVFLGFFVAIVTESLSLAGVVTVNGAFIALGFAWVVGLGSTYFLDHIWPITGRHRILFSVFLGVFLLGIGFAEYKPGPTEPAKEMETPRPISPEMLAMMTNEELRRAAYKAADEINTLVYDHISQEQMLEEQKPTDNTEDEKIKVDVALSNKFREQSKLYLSIYAEFAKRGVQTNYEDYLATDVSKPDYIGRRNRQLWRGNKTLCTRVTLIAHSSTFP